MCLLFSCYVHQDELEAHSVPDSITVFVHYGGDRTCDPKVIAEPDVVLTTYGVLTAAYKSVSNPDLFALILKGGHRIRLRKK